MNKQRPATGRFPGNATDYTAIRSAQHTAIADYHCSNFGKDRHDKAMVNVTESALAKTEENH